MAEAGVGHGKVILLGEHAVVYGQPALAAGMKAGVRATAVPGDGQLRVPAWQLTARAGDGTPVGTALSRLLARLGHPRLDFDVAAEIPSRAGLGSSAALSVAVARAAARYTGATEADVMAAVNDAETVFHGTPSGIDAAACSRGGVGLYRRGEGWTPVPLRKSFKLCVGLSGRPRDTSAQVEAVARLCSRTPAARRVIDLMGETATAGCEALAAGDIDGLGRLLDVAHGLLGALRVSSPELDELVHLARERGAIGAKLTGAGGGGAVIALAPSHTRDVLARWQERGYDGFITEVGVG